MSSHPAGDLDGSGSGVHSYQSAESGGGQGPIEGYPCSCAASPSCGGIGHQGNGIGSAALLDQQAVLFQLEQVRKGQITLDQLVQNLGAVPSSSPGVCKHPCMPIGSGMFNTGLQGSGAMHEGLQVAGAKQTGVEGTASLNPGMQGMDTERVGEQSISAMPASTLVPGAGHAGGQATGALHMGLQSPGVNLTGLRGTGGERTGRPGSEMVVPELQGIDVQNFRELEMSTYSMPQSGAQVGLPQGAAQVGLLQGAAQEGMPQGAAQVGMPQGAIQVGLPQGARCRFNFLTEACC